MKYIVTIYTATSATEVIFSGENAHCEASERLIHENESGNRATIDWSCDRMRSYTVTTKSGKQVNVHARSTSSAMTRGEWLVEQGFED